MEITEFGIRILGRDRDWLGFFVLFLKGKYDIGIFFVFLVNINVDDHIKSKLKRHVKYLNDISRM